jgi:hypothetical protein
MAVNRLPLVEQALRGENRHLTLLAAKGMLPVPPGDLVAAQVKLADHSDQEIAAAARSALESLGHQVLVPLLSEAGESVLGYLGRTSGDPRVLEAILRRRDVPTAVLVELAPRLGADLQEILLLRQDRIVAEPTILESLERNPSLSAFSRRRIAEYREHLLGGVQAEAMQEPEAPAPEEIGHDLVPLDDPEVMAALAQARAAAPEGEVDESTGLSEGQIRTLPIPVRMKLARGAPRALRSLLIRDANPRVALAVLSSNPLADQEVEGIAKNRTVVEDVLDAIARERRWVSKYPIVLALVNNPRTPVGVSTKLVPRLSVRDLRNLSRDRNVPDAVRNMAQRLYRVKLK